MSFADKVNAVKKTGNAGYQEEINKAGAILAAQWQTEFSEDENSLYQTLDRAATAAIKYAGYVLETINSKFGEEYYARALQDAVKRAEAFAAAR